MSLLVGPALALTLGVACGVWYAALLPVPGLVAGFGLSVAIAARAWRTGAGGVLWATLVVAAGSGGALVGGRADERASATPLRALLDLPPAGAPWPVPAPIGRAADPVLLEGRLRSDASPSPSGVTLRLDVERAWAGICPAPAAGGVQLTVVGAVAPEAALAWTAGRRVVVPAVLRRPGVFLDAGVADAERQLAWRGTTLVGTVKSGLLVTPMARGHWGQEAAAALRMRARRAITRAAGADAQAAAVGTAILIGDRSGLAPHVERRLQEAGTYHVLAISGGNLAIFGGAVLAGAALFGFHGAGAVAAALAAVLAYAAVTTGGASVWRAAAMAAVVLGARLLDERTPPLNSLALAVAALVVYAPLLAVDTGLALTAGATAGIVLGAGRLTTGGPRLWRWTAAVVVASLAAEAALLPIQARVFQRVTLAGLVLNLVAIPSMTVVQFAALGAVMADATWPALLPVAGVALRAGVAGLLHGPALLDAAPWLTWRVPPPATAVVAAYYLAAAAALSGLPPRCGLPAMRRAGRAAAALAAVLGAWIAVHPPSLRPPRGDGRLHVTMLDVGQGDAMLVTFPDGHRLLVDAGAVTAGGFDTGERVVGPALRARGVRTIDYLLVTHGDPDHLGGAASVLADFAPREVWEGVPVPGHAGLAALRAQAAAARTPWRSLVAGGRLAIGGVDLQVLHPPPADWERRKVRNDDSVTLRIDHGQTTLLSTGDIGAEVESRLAAGEALAGRKVLLKVAHHGSLTSSGDAWLAWAQPELALVSAGRGNRFGHPAAPVLDRLAAIGAAVWRTDRDGEITATSDGRGWTVRAPYAQPR